MLASVAAAAGPPAQCAAQSGSQQRGSSLSAAIEEARRTPFHADPVASTHGEAMLSWAGTGAGPVSQGLQEAPEYVSLPPPVVAFTFIASVAGNLAGSYLFFYCLDNDSYSSGIAGCIVGPIIPFLAVAAPAAGTELGPRKAFKASAFGWVGGAAAFSLTVLASDRISNAGMGLISGVVHAIVGIAVLRRP